MAPEAENRENSEERDALDSPEAEQGELGAPDGSDDSGGDEAPDAPGGDETSDAPDGDETPDAPDDQVGAEDAGDADDAGEPDAAEGKESALSGDGIGWQPLIALVATGVILVAIFVSVLTSMSAPDGGDEGEPDDVRAETASSSSAASPAPSSASAASGDAAASSSGSNVASGSSASSTPASASDSAAAPADYGDARFHDGFGSPSLYSIIELTGAELSNLLESCDFRWDGDYTGWAAPSGSLLVAIDASGMLDRGRIAALPRGAAGQPVAIALTVRGYSTPSSAFAALASDITIEDKSGDDEMLFAVIQGSSTARYLVSVTTTDEGEQSFLLLTEEAIASGLLSSLVGVDAGSTLEETWQAVTGGSHIGADIGG